MEEKRYYTQQRLNEYIVLLLDNADQLLDSIVRYSNAFTTNNLLGSVERTAIVYILHFIFQSLAFKDVSSTDQVFIFSTKVLIFSIVLFFFTVNRIFISLN